MLLISVLIRKKILWGINFILIKFLLNALLFEKLQNECKNLSLLHKATCINLDHSTTKMQCHLFTFMACNYRGLCNNSINIPVRVVQVMSARCQTLCCRVWIDTFHWCLKFIHLFRLCFSSFSYSYNNWRSPWHSFNIRALENRPFPSCQCFYTLIYN